MADSSMVSDEVCDRGIEAGRKASGLSRLAILIPLLFLWAVLITHLKTEWNLNPQYSYGWIVPLLCIGFLWRRWLRADGAGVDLLRPAFEEHGTSDSPRHTSNGWLFFWLLSAILFLPIRLVQEAAPEWRVVGWALALLTVGLTLLGVYVAYGYGWMRRCMFPVLFFLVAVPWLRPIEYPLIRGLARLNTTLGVEIVGFFGTPALRHGNVIEVASGVVGVDDACSGIRSFQSSLMVSLCLGELYRLSVAKRMFLCLAGFVSAFAFNVCRTTLLVWVASRKGVDAIDAWHDPAGISITIACFFCVWILSGILRRKPGDLEKQSHAQPVHADSSPSVRAVFSSVGSWSCECQNPASSSFVRHNRRIVSFAAAMTALIACTEIATSMWYRTIEASSYKPGLDWSVSWPTNRSTLEVAPIRDNARATLKFDRGEQAAWKEDDGNLWAAFFLQWFPGKSAGYLARRHTPEACLAGVNWKLQSRSEVRYAQFGELKLPYQLFVFSGDGGTRHVLYVRWEEGKDPETYVPEELSVYNILRPVWTGRGKRGQKVFEMTFQGNGEDREIEQAMLRQLSSLIEVK